MLRAVAFGSRLLPTRPVKDFHLQSSAHAGHTNADIADAAVSDSQTIVLTGKRFGTTNLVILDKDGNAIVDERVLVSLETKNTVREYRQDERHVLTCTPDCENLDLPE